MFSSYLLALAVAGTVNAATPNAFEPASTQDLTVAFGNELATDGVNIARAKTLNAPTIGTTEKLFGTYAVMMVDPDIPGAPTDSKTGQILHWMKADLVSSNTATTVAGQQIFELRSPSNSSEITAYRQPSPPNRALTTHRYIQLLVNTTDSSPEELTNLRNAGAVRTNFSALATVEAADVDVVFANYFNVTNEEALAGGNVTGGSPNGTANGSPTTPNTGVPAACRSRVMVAGVGAFAAALLML